MNSDKMICSQTSIKYITQPLAKRRNSSFISKNRVSLDYTFSSIHQQIRQEKPKRLINSQELTGDLINTWKINLELIESFLKKNFRNNDEFIEIVHKIKKLFDLKVELRKKEIELKAKLLIDMQIKEEAKRNLNECSEYEQMQIKDLLNNAYLKQQYINAYELKIKEVWTYTKMNSNKTFWKFGRSVAYMKEFLDKNFFYVTKKSELINEIEKIKEELKEYIKENYKLTEKHLYLQNHPNKLTCLERNEKDCKQTKYIQKLIVRNQLLENYLMKMQSLLKYITVETQISKVK